MKMPYLRRSALALLSLVLLVASAACGGGGGSSPPGTTQAPSLAATAAAPTVAAPDDGLVGKPQARSGIGDVDGAFARYADSRGEFIDLIKAQDWYKDGLTREEALFVERMLTYVARMGGPRTAYISDTTVRQRLFLYDKATTRTGDVDLILVFEPNQDAAHEMALIKKTVPFLEDLVGAQWPEQVITVVNGSTSSTGSTVSAAAGTAQSGFVQIARCCTQDAGVITHELAHTYWSYEVGPQWFAEGMADVYSALVTGKLNADPPAGWRVPAVDLDVLYGSRKSSLGGKLTSVIPKGRAADLNYASFDALLLEIRNSMGPDNFLIGARQIFLASDFGRTSIKEKRLEDIFLANTPPAGKQGVMDAFNQAVWGDNGERYKQLVEQEGP